jgi:hypothetical protein
LKRNYIPSAKNHTAVTITRSWLTACGIPHDKGGRSGVDLVVKASNGSSFDVAIIKDTTPPSGCIVVPASELTGKRSRAFAAFHRITSAAGYGLPIPVDRQEDPIGPDGKPFRPRFDEAEFDLVAFRHREFRKCPDPSPEEWKDYMSVIEVAIKRFYTTNYTFLKQNGMELQDLTSFAMVWATNYIKLYQDSTKDIIQNRKLMHAHLKQRFSEFRTLLYKKNRSCIPDRDVAEIALTGNIEDGNRQAGRGTDLMAWPARQETPGEALQEAVDEELDLEAEDNYQRNLAVEAVLGGKKPKATASEKTRRRKGQRRLRQALATLDHDALLKALGEASENKALCFDAQHEARRQLRVHQRACEACKAAAPKVHPPTAKKEQNVPEAEIGSQNAVYDATTEANIETWKREAFEALPETLQCPHCQEMKPRKAFGIRFPRRKKGTPAASWARRQSQCSSCRGRSKKVSQDVGTDPTTAPAAQP